MLMQRTAQTASEIGLRHHNADAAQATATAWALADGIGDTPAAAHAAALAVTAAVGAEDALQGVQAARAALQATTGDAVLVVATPLDDGFDIAWVGDVRAYHWNGETLTQLTTDNTVAQYFRSRGAVPAPRMEHVVTTTVRHGQISRANAPAGRLLLTTDGVHKVLDIHDMTAIVSGGDAASRMVRAAMHVGGTDNATALVVD